MVPLIVKILIGAVVLYAAFIGALYLFQRKIVFVPDTRVPSLEAAGVPALQEVRLNTADGLSLLAWYHPSKPNRPTLVYFHGNAGTIESRGFKAKPFLKEGIGVLLVEYRGYGGNDGAPSEDGFYADGRAAIDFLMKRGVQSAQMVLYGESIGSGTAVHLAYEDADRAPYGAVILESGLTSIVDMASERYPFVPVSLFVKDRFDSLNKIGKIRSPILIMHGRQDQLVPFSHAEKMFEAAPQPKELAVFDDAGHVNLFDYQAEKHILTFIWRHLGQT